MATAGAFSPRAFNPRAFSVWREIPAPGPVPAGGGYVSAVVFPFPLPKARPILTTFGPSPVRLVVGGHVEARTIHAASPQVSALHFSGVAGGSSIYDLARQQQAEEEEELLLDLLGLF